MNLVYSKFYLLIPLISYLKQEKNECPGLAWKDKSHNGSQTNVCEQIKGDLAMI